MKKVIFGFLVSVSAFATCNIHLSQKVLSLDPGLTGSLTNKGYTVLNGVAVKNDGDLVVSASEGVERRENISPIALSSHTEYRKVYKAQVRELIANIVNEEKSDGTIDSKEVIVIGDAVEKRVKRDWFWTRNRDSLNSNQTKLDNLLVKTIKGLESCK